MKNALERQAHRDYTFGSYITGNNIAWMQNINRLIETDFAKYDCIIIKCTGGMGGTHILHSFYNSLVDKEYKPKMADTGLIFKSKSELRSLFETDYLLIDNIYTQQIISSYFEKLVKKHFHSGRKLFLKINPVHLDPRIYIFFEQFRIHEIYPVPVSYEILLEMANKHNLDGEESLDKDEIEIICRLKYYNYRFFQALFLNASVAKMELKPSEQLEGKIMEFYERFK